MEISLSEFKKGNLQTFSQVYKEMYPAIVYYSRKIIEDDAEAEDIASIAFQALWNKKETIQSHNNIKNFLYRVAKNRCIDHLKSISRRTNSHKEILYLSKEGEPGSDHNLISAEVFNQIRLEIGSMPGHWASVFELMYYERKNTKEVSEILGIRKQTVLNYKSKAITFLRDALQKKGIITPSLIIIFATLGMTK